MIQLYGFAPSVYVRSVRMALEEKGVAYQLTEVDPFVEGGPPDWYRALNPFGKIPAFRDGDLELFESDAILRYLEAAYPEPALSPGDPVGIARMTQMMRIIDNYAYRSMVWGVYVPLNRQATRGEAAVAAQIDKALAESERVLQVIDRVRPEGAPFLAGDALTLADTHAYPIMAYFAGVEPGRKLLSAHPGTEAWLAAMAQRPSAVATKPPRR